MAIAHPRRAEVQLSNGEIVFVRPWTMARRAELKPKVLAVLDAIAGLKGGFAEAAGSDLVALFSAVEDEVIAVVRASIPLEDLSEEQWDEMEWGDAPNLAQALWDLNITGAGGVVGKMGAALGTMLSNAIIAAAKAKGEEAQADAAEKSDSSPPTLRSLTETKQPDSSTSRADGEPTQSA